MNVSPPALSKLVPFLGLLLVVEGSLWFPFDFHPAYRRLDAAFVASVLAIALYCSLRTDAARAPVKCRSLLVLSVLLNVFAASCACLITSPRRSALRA